jgi:hypothetical protein
VKSYRVHKASPLRTPIEGFALIADKELPVAKTLKTAAARHEKDARVVADALTLHLPQGTVDRVLRLLLESRASLLRIRGID